MKEISTFIKQPLGYNKIGNINLCFYSDDGFLENELDIITLVLDKLYDDYNL